MSEQRNRIRSIAIVGGGTAGWMAAVALGYTHREGPCTVRLIESDEIGTVGVGEATLPILRLFNRFFGIDEDEFMRATQASFKAGIQFEDWARMGYGFFHPFGGYGAPIERLRFYQCWLKQHKAGSPYSLNAYSENAVAAKLGRFARARWPNGEVADNQYAFHFDAALYAAYLRRRAISFGVQRTEGRVDQVKLRESDGFIESIKLVSGEVVEADLFIDCSGFRGLLIEGALHTGYEDWSRWLPCNRAWAVLCEGVDAITPYTRSTARKAGWQWRIPLQHRIGNGYVYCNERISDDEAAATLLANLDGRALDEPRQLRFTAGRRKLYWNRNCIALGLASGFLEPLESSSIGLMQNAIFRLLELMTDRGFEQATVDEYNRQTILETERTRDFIVLHYLGNGRHGEPMWDDCRHMEAPAHLQERIDLFRVRGHLNLENEPYGETSWLVMLTELGFVPRDYNPLIDALPAATLEKSMADIRDQVVRYVQGLPAHRAYLEANCRADSPVAVATPTPMAVRA
ncbi:tryptophan 7-halogenase [Variovorax sp. J22R133]|uniref:tryptophan halogenase family protein n=1 Tax=Variovorax brevis TaxID=3053503 RepID=UPI002575D9A0|nr:tryptophan halogenase family protein [Variovorax sp. J22R133]MDM0114357.1 tryptophan 7-halogenase [Variovorax sp. J22R133]